MREKLETLPITRRFFGKCCLVTGVTLVACAKHEEGSASGGGHGATGGASSSSANAGSTGTGSSSTGAMGAGGGKPDGGMEDAGLPQGAPAWVPTSPWVWTDIPGTVFNDYMKSDGTGIAPAAGAEPGGGGNAPTYPSYAKQTSFGGPAYSRKHHELYLFGGGHAATTLNALARWNLHKDAPDMTLLCPPTAASVRQAGWLDAGVRSSGYWPDGKPKSAHMYHALQYLDAVDELVAVGLAFGVDPVTDSRGWPTVACFKRGEAAWKATGYWPDLPSEQNETAMLADAPTFASWDGASVYYYRDGGGSGPWRRLDSSSHSIQSVGGTLDWWRTMQGAARHDKPEALLVGGEPGGGSGYQLKLLDLSTGLHTAMTSVGFASPNDCSIKDLAWVSKLGVWVAWFTDVITDNDPIGVQRVIKFEQTGPTEITCTEIATTGNPPTGDGGCKQGMYWDDAYECLIFVGNMSENLKALRVA